MQFKSELLTEQTACNTTALIAAYKAYPPNGGSNSVPLGLCARCYPMRHGPPVLTTYELYFSCRQGKNTWATWKTGPHAVCETELPRSIYKSFRRSLHLSLADTKEMFLIISQMSDINKVVDAS